MGATAFDANKLNEYKNAARESWGGSPQWAEYEQKSAGRTSEDEAATGAQLMAMFAPFGRMAANATDPACDEAQALVSKMQAFITRHFYTCTNEVLLQLGKGYGSGGEFTQNINAAAGSGAAEFAAAAIEAHCKLAGLA